MNIVDNRKPTTVSLGELIRLCSGQIGDTRFPPEKLEGAFYSSSFGVCLLCGPPPNVHRPTGKVDAFCLSNKTHYTFSRDLAVEPIAVEVSFK